MICVGQDENLALRIKEHYYSPIWVHSLAVFTLAERASHL
jgi:hypothetical protein